MDLFEGQHQQRRAAAQPLAARLRPATLEDFVGQAHFLGPGRLLRRQMEADRLGSMILCGPPGTGKTTLARIIARETRAHFVAINAIASSVRELREILQDARARLETDAARTILFIDELHRFNRAQQDVLLGDVESGVVILIGATTENPFFAVNAPLVSRSQLFQFETLAEDDLLCLFGRACDVLATDLDGCEVVLEDPAARHVARFAAGDARRALNALEVAVRSQYFAEQRRCEKAPARVRIDLAAAEDSIQQKAPVYGRDGDGHYDCISALIKSMRGSDPDAAVYWLARMVEAGEDPRFIARRLVIFAAEDVGNADPQALVLAQAAAEAVQFIGFPEGQLPLAQTALYLACTRKSRATADAIAEAMADVKAGSTIPVPAPIRDRHYRGADRLAAGIPEKSSAKFGVTKRYYAPGRVGVEADWAEMLATMRKARDPGDATSQASR